jgi:hypothetical protein
MTSSQPIKQELQALVGAVVLSTQDAERYLKAILPFVDAQDPSLGAALERHGKLKNSTFGGLVTKFKDASTSDSPGFADHLASLVESRNQIVHHFSETYGERLRAGQVEDVLLSLRTLLANVDVFRDLLEKMTLLLFEAMRDTTFQGTPEFQEMDEACVAFRQTIARSGGANMGGD